MFLAQTHTCEDLHNPVLRSNHLWTWNWIWDVHMVVRKARWRLLQELVLIEATLGNRVWDMQVVYVLVMQIEIRHRIVFVNTSNHMQLKVMDTFDYVINPRFTKIGFLSVDCRVALLEQRGVIYNHIVFIDLFIILPRPAQAAK